MREEATTRMRQVATERRIVALRDERGSYNAIRSRLISSSIVALRDERGSYNDLPSDLVYFGIVALRDERGSYNSKV